MGFQRDVEKMRLAVWRVGDNWEEELLDHLATGRVFVIVVWEPPHPN